MIEIEGNTAGATGEDSAETSAGRRYADRVETAAYLGVSVRTVDTLLKEKKIPHYRVGRRVMFDLHDIAKWMQTSCKVVCRIVPR